VKLVTLGNKCKAVIGCRVSPKQKRDIVKLVKDNMTPTPITLSIGARGQQNKTNARAFLEPFLDTKTLKFPRQARDTHTHTGWKKVQHKKRRLFYSCCSFLCRGWRERRRYDTGGAHWRRDFRKRGRAGTYTKTHLVCDAVFYP
jgi:hypothetical protein